MAAKMFGVEPKDLEKTLIIRTMTVRGQARAPPKVPYIHQETDTSRICI